VLTGSTILGYAIARISTIALSPAASAACMLVKSAPPVPTADAASILYASVAAVAGSISPPPFS